MAGALVAPPARRLAGFLPHLRPGLRSAWSSAWIDADPAFATNPANSKGTASTTRARQKKLSNRLTSVVEAVDNRKIPPELRGGADAVRSETDIINVVERRIWHSMEEGHFENLPGKGKPLKLSANPHADPAEDTLYRILSRNGCAPEWVELNKEIRLTIAEWRSALKKAWAKRSNHEHSGWLEDSQALQEQMRDINSKVLRYNLIAPFGRQVFGVKWEKEIDKLEQPITDASL